MKKLYSLGGENIFGKSRTNSPEESTRPSINDERLRNIKKILGDDKTKSKTGN